MTTPMHDSEPTWYHRTVDTDAEGFAFADDDHRPDHRVKAAVAGLIVVILCAMGVSVAALKSDGSAERPTRTETAGAPGADEEADEDADEATAEPTGQDDDERVSLSQTGEADEGDEPTTTKAPSQKPPTTKAPTTNPPTTKAPTTAPPTTKPPTTNPPTTAPTTTKPAAPKPEVQSVSAPGTYACSEAPEFESPNTITVSWTTKNATSVSLAIDSPTGIYQSDLPANGSLVVSAPCQGDSNTYYVIAHGADGTTATKSATTNGI